MRQIVANLFVSLTGCAGISAQAVLTMTIDNYVPYFDDVSDPKTFASNPNMSPGTNGEFMRFVFVGDIVAVNDEPVKGTWSATTTVLFLTPIPTPKQAIADSTRQNILEMFFDLEQPDGTPIGTLMTSGLTRGLPPPGAPKLQTENSMAIIGGTGAFLGIRGQVGIINRGSPRVASMVEDPANRRTNGGAKRSYVFHLIPLTTPEILLTPAGPAVVHSTDGTLVNAANPAKAGETLTLYAAGLGPTRPGVIQERHFPLIRRKPRILRSKLSSTERPRQCCTPAAIPVRRMAIR